MKKEEKIKRRQEEECRVGQDSGVGLHLVAMKQTCSCIFHTDSTE